MGIENEMHRLGAPEPDPEWDRMSDALDDASTDALVACYRKLKGDDALAILVWDELRQHAEDHGAGAVLGAMGK